ncbi:MAG: hypothetical protein K9N49_06835 [Candidatus Marinimicrobia bacterium]|nr:hypothetical protein [Candidatus Neomarinimicrobiota bacterium]
MIEWCNNNSGFMMASLTLVYVVATMTVVGLMVWANRLTARNTQIAIHLDKERSKPVVIMEILPDVPVFILKVRNIGLTAAHHVRFAIAPEPKLCFGGQNQYPPEKTERTIHFVTEGIRSLPPQGEVATTLGTLDRIEEGLGSLHFRGKISYTDPLGEAHVTIVDSDLAIFRGLAYSGKKPIVTVAKELEKISQELGYIGSGFHKPTVLTQDIKEHRQEERDFVECAMKTMDQMEAADQLARQAPPEGARRSTSDKSPV